MAPRPIRSRGSLHTYACFEGTKPRLVMVSAADAPAEAARVRLDAIAHAHQLLDHPLFPKVFVRERVGEIELLAFDCDAVTDFEAVLLSLAEREESMCDEHFSALQLAAMDAVAHMHNTLDPDTGRPVVFGVVDWSKMVCNAAGNFFLIGAGDRFMGRRRSMLSSSDAFLAPEVANGAEPSMASDLFSLHAMVQQVHDTMIPPEPLKRIFRGEPLPEDVVLMELLAEAHRRVTANVRERAHSIRELREVALRLWEELGTVPDPEGLRRLITDAYMRSTADDDTIAISGSASPTVQHSWRHGRYRAERELGSGAMGTVFLAWDRELEQHVAIKILERRIQGKPRERFIREVRLMRQLRHANLVAGYDLLVEEDGLGAVMEYIDGPSLKERLQGDVAAGDACAWARDVAAALVVLHDSHVVHRDVKPANIIVAPQRGAVLVDLGVASEQESDLTRTGSLVGTPAYMAPEQFLGRDITSATDVYALAIILVEALSGTHPFAANTALEAFHARTQNAEQAARVAAIPQALAPILQRCFAVDPAQRPTASGLHDALDKLAAPAR